MPKGGCFRAVLDGAITMHDGDNHPNKYRDQVQKLLEELFGANPIKLATDRTKTYKATDFNDAAVSENEVGDLPLEVGEWGVARVPVSKRPRGWGQLHSDFYENKIYKLSAVLHLDDAHGGDTELVGGETGMVDAFDEATASLVKGLIVEPARGRLVLFSGGGENYHAPLRVEQGSRRAYHAWFNCEPDMFQPECSD
jgi:hypothetical protein